MGWQACNELGVSVARVPAYSPYAVAEHAVGMLMCLNRKLHLAYNKVHARPAHARTAAAPSAYAVAAGPPVARQAARSAWATLR